MNQAQDRDSKILAGYKKVFAAPEVMAKRYKNTAFVLLFLGVVVAYISGYLVSEKAMYDAGQLLAMLAGLLFGLALLFLMNSKQMISFAKFCTLKSQYLESPNKCATDNDGAAPRHV